jgi:hypothetical protein
MPQPINIARYCLLVLPLLGGGCKAQPPEMLHPSVSGYNHTSAAINNFTVNGSGGGNIGPHEGGGSFVCCTTVPRQWRAGMKATVEWEKDPEPFSSVNWPQPMFSEAWNKQAEAHRAQYTRHRVTVEIPRYEGVGSMNVHFLPCDQVLVAVNGVLPGYPGYPHNDVINALNMEEPEECPKP